MKLSNSPESHPPHLVIAASSMKADATFEDRVLVAESFHLLLSFCVAYIIAPRFRPLSYTVLFAIIPSNGATPPWTSCKTTSST